MLNSMSGINNPWSPLSWAGQGLVNLGEGNWVLGALYLLVTIGIGAAIFAIALVTAEKTLFQRVGWRPNQLAEKEENRAPRESGRSSCIRVWPPGYSRPRPGDHSQGFPHAASRLAELITVDDPSHPGSDVWNLAILRQGTRVPLGQGNAPQWVNQLITSGFSYADIGIAHFCRLDPGDDPGWQGFRPGGQELLDDQIRSPQAWSDANLQVPRRLDPGSRTWLDLSNRLCRAAAGEVANLPFSMLAVGLCFAGAASISEAFGVAGARFDWTDPRKMESGPTGCISGLVCFVYMGFSLLFLVGPALLLPALGLPIYSGQLGGIFLGGAVCLAAVHRPACDGSLAGG